MYAHPPEEQSNKNVEVYPTAVMICVMMANNHITAYSQHYMITFPVYICMNMPLNDSDATLDLTPQISCKYYPSINKQLSVSSW